MKIFSRADKNISINTATIVKAIFLTITAVIAVQFIRNVSHQLTLIAVAAFLALALNPAVSWITLRLKSKSRVRATGVAYLIVITILVTFISVVVPPLVHQTSDFISSVPTTINDFKNQDSTLANLVRRYHLENQVDKIRDDFSNRIGDFSGPVLSTAGKVGGALVSVITVLVLTFMMLVEGPLWVDRILQLVPEQTRARRKDILKRMYRVVTGYVNGQVLIAAIAASFAAIALLIGSSIFNASINPAALAGIIFLFGLIPLFGNILGASIVVLVCLLSSGPLAIMMAIFFLIYQQIENATLQPYIQSRSNQLTPLTVFIAALLGVGIGGILGALAAIPIAGCLRILVEEYLHTRLPGLRAVEAETKK
jgi:predicted PurR-regulated permease PerM